MPLRNDWKSATELIRRIDRVLTGEQFSLDVVIMDDLSSQGFAASDFGIGFTSVVSIEVVRLQRNVGHQRAIAVGLGYVDRNKSLDAVVVMDSDGEDTPAGVLQLLTAFCKPDRKEVIFAERVKRSESPAFKASYQLYRWVHFLLTGVQVRVGNFSVMSREALATLAVHSELWNHYAAGVYISKLPISTVPVPRGKRIDGVSQMNFVSLVAHGLSAISVFGERVGVRILISSSVASVFVVFAIVVVIVLRLFSNLAIPGWATSAMGFLVIVLIQLIAIAASFTFFMLSTRANLGFIPSRDYSLFLAKTTEVYRRE